VTSARREWWLALAVGVAFRALVISQVAYTREGDALSYQQFADNLVQTGTYGLVENGVVVPSAYRPPGYAAVVAVTQAVTRTEGFGLRALQVLLSVASALVLARAVGRWRPRAKRWALWLLVLNPFDGYFAGAMLSETLCAALVTAAVVLFLRARRSAMVLAGVVFGVTVLTRDQLVLLPAAFALVLAWVGWRPVRRRLGRLKWVAAMPLVAGLVVLPWTARNAVQFGRFIPISKGRLGYNLWLGTWERTSAWLSASGIDYPDYAFDSPEERALVLGIGDDMYSESGDKAFMKLAVDRMKAHPARTVVTWVRRAPMMWVGTRTDLFTLGPLFPRGSPQWTVHKASHWGLNLLLVLAGFSGLRLLRSKSRRQKLLVALVATPVLYSAVLYLPLHSTENRYSHPVLPCLVVLAALNLEAAWSRWRARSTSNKASPA
jgi:hypothetical protein